MTLRTINDVVRAMLQSTDLNSYWLSCAALKRSLWIWNLTRSLSRFIGCAGGSWLSCRRGCLDWWWGYWLWCRGGWLDCRGGWLDCRGAWLDCRGAWLYVWPSQIWSWTAMYFSVFSSRFFKHVPEAPLPWPADVLEWKQDLNNIQERLLFEQWWMKYTIPLVK